MIRIDTTLDCIGKLTPFEKMLLAIIKGVLYEYYHDRDTRYTTPADYHIIIKPTDGDKKSGLTTFKVGGKTPVGLFDSVKELITPFSCGFVLQGGYNQTDNSTAMILQRFELKRQTLNYYTTETPKV